MAIFTNTLNLATLCGSLLLNLTYSGALLEDDSLPCVTFIVLFAIQFVAMVAFLTVRGRAEAAERKRRLTLGEI